MGVRGQPRHSLALFLSLSLRAALGVTVGKDLEDKQHHTNPQQDTAHIRTHIYKFWIKTHLYTVKTQPEMYTKAWQLQNFHKCSPLALMHTSYSGNKTHTKKRVAGMKPTVVRLDAEVRLQQ